MNTKRQLPEWAHDERVCNEYIDALADIFRTESADARATFKKKRAAEYGRFAEVICDLAVIKTDAPLMLAQ